MNHNAYEHCLNRLQAEADAKVATLISKADWVGQRLMRLATKLEEEGIDYHFNTLGELQASGPEIDRLCGELGVLKDTLELLKIMKDEAEEDVKS